MQKSRRIARPLERLKSVRFFEFKGRKYDLLEEVGIEEDKLDKIFMEHSERSAFWSVLRSNVRSKLRKLEDELKELEGEKFVAYWDYMVDQNRHFSDSYVRAHMNMDPTIVEKRKEVRIVQRTWEVLCAVCDAMEHRRSCLMQIGSRQRREHEYNEGLSSRKRRTTHGSE